MFTKDELPVVGILRGITEKDVTPLAEVFRRTGTKYIEITMNTPGASRLIQQMAAAGQGQLLVGAGTVLSREDLDQALEAGARFIVTPSVKDEVITSCVQNHIPVFPGILTPTELHRALDLGASTVKLFPAGAFGPGYIKALKGPFETVKILAVGGVNEQNVSDYMQNGADGIAFGAGVVKPAWLAANQYQTIEQKLLELLNQCRLALDRQ